MKTFPPNFLGGGGFPLADSFSRFSGELPGTLRELSVCRESPRLEIEWKSLCFVLCLFIH